MQPIGIPSWMFGISIANTTTFNFNNSFTLRNLEFGGHNLSPPILSLNIKIFYGEQKWGPDAIQNMFGLQRIPY